MNDLATSIGRPLAGRSILVTGGTSPIGAAIVRRLGAAGASVVVHVHRPPPPGAMPDAAALLRADLAAPSGPEQLFRDALAVAPALDAVVNNAAAFLPDDAPPEELDRMRRLNLDAPLRLLAALASRPGRPAACVAVHLLDARIAAPAAAPGHSAYLRTKRDLAAAVARDAARIAPDGIRVVGIAPGPVSLPAGVHVPAGPMPLAGVPRPAPDDVADAVAWALGARQVTGQILYVDAGQHLALQENRT